MPNQANSKDMFSLALGTRALQWDTNLKAAMIALDFVTGGATIVVLDMQIPEGAKKISAVLGLYIDNSLNGSTLQIQMDKSQQSIIVPANSQALLPILASPPEKITFTTTGGIIVPIQVLNFRPDPIIWGVAGQIVRDIFRSNVTMSSIIPGASTNVAPANANRTLVAIQAKTTNVASCWINIAAVAANNAQIELPPGATWSMQEPGLVDTRDIFLFGAATDRVVVITG